MKKIVITETSLREQFRKWFRYGKYDVADSAAYKEIDEVIKRLTK